MIRAASPAIDKEQQVLLRSVHGSSTAIPDRNPAGTTANWSAVLAFLRGVAG